MMVVDLSVRVFPNTRTDLEMSDWLVRQKGTGHNSGRWVRYKLNPERLERVSRCAGEIRRTFDSNTLAWKRGERIIPAPCAAGLQRLMDDKIWAFEREADLFASGYTAAVDEARRMHGESFAEKDYPPDIRRFFRATLEWWPMPKPEALPRAWREAFNDVVSRAVEDRLARARAEFWERMEAPLRHMAATLAVPDRRFWDSLVDNVREVALVARTVTVHLDAAFKAKADEIIALLKGVTPDLLRENPHLRKEIAMAAAKAADNIGALRRRIVVKE